ncbi:MULTISPECIES: beta-galactosidase [unclassified Microbacterium]|uniref:beta-galactosidase n=1 Tax=unclassified Microbacterium TaxID=2609290 RepID=UPI000EA9D681|nr:MULTISPECIES: beta-galactosidase [unclassified Microbacterium]MBT2484404.1 beta-galactosidase [Microbacterium sp. ISL-108]RKN67315.1 beta-galactosidase [Microbacterium sp. CGR2]
MHYGGDYYPEQWDRAIWQEDIERMQEAGVTLVTVGVFAWGRIQRREGEFDWDWLDEILDLLHGAGIGVNLATATASPPPWATTAYPQMLPRDREGVVYSPGSRQHYAPTSPEYRRLASDLVATMAARYARHPAVQMWHVNNEYGCHLHHDYSENAERAFRRWLQEKYRDIGTLNARWGTVFWSQGFGSFDEVPLPRHAPYIHNPASELDFRRFTSDALLELFVMERDILRAAGATQPVTTNFMGAFPAADYWRWAQEVDIISDDTYPDPNDPEAYLDSAFTRDLMRSLKPGLPWLVMEQATEAANSRITNAPKAPGQAEALSLQSVGRGADGILFFQWRQSRRGAEKFHSAMLPHAGTDTRIWREVVRLGEALRALPELPAGTSGARIALVFQWDSWWAASSPDLPTVVDYEAHARAWHGAAQQLHLPVDLVRGDEDLSRYDLVIAPSLFLVDDRTAGVLRHYVEAGGHLFVTAFSDVVDADCAFREGGFTVALREVLGIEALEFGALVPPGGDHGPGLDSVTVHTPFGDLRGHTAAEVIRVHGAEVIGRFAGGREVGAPALTRNTFGDGHADYLATVPDASAARAILESLCATLGIESLLDGAPVPFVDASRRGEYVTIINHGGIDATVPISGTDIHTSQPVTQLRLQPYEWAIIRTEEETS